MSILEREDQLQAAPGAQTAFPAPIAQINSPGQPGLTGTRARVIIATSLIALGAVCLVIKLAFQNGLSGDISHGWLLDRLIPRVEAYFSGWSLEMMIAFPLGLLTIFMLEQFFPAVPRQKILSNGLVNDAMWILIRSAAQLILFSSYSRLLYRMYTGHLGFLSLPVPESVPMVARLAIGAIVADFAQWFQHWLHHKVKWLWAFHAVHHSQRELNVFGDYRGHFMEYVVRRPILLLPLLMLGVQEPEMLWWVLLINWQTRLNHANVRFNFGPLRYIIVTPQSHRVHHSMQAEHIDHNYGSIFSFWDYLFGTQVRDYDVYPETGIDDEEFPIESSESVRGMLITVVRQIVYPFKQCWTLATDRPRVR